MGFCTEEEAETFLDDAPIFERMLVNGAIRLFKYYLDVDPQGAGASAQRASARPVEPMEGQPGR
jgi:polyphosphate kinase 2 (PPK2 family)